ncbi:hypothetical protein [Rhizobium rhizogenes]|uniref:Uncharacterized protein n=1 Tax=Rhizobium rhizogenes (strain K84 / ATCC BAA-868) TaxID=311403 RepID=B9JQN4_RHIR8|nr:hypothetical protein Arad_12503 [Rhizobium rhizogenes K84]NTG77850.1 hypothetical protein [Rhizobium rhizogenes]
MYSTLDGAKNHAKQLKRILSASGLIYSLAKCQAAVARAGGFRDWHDLTTNLQVDARSRPFFDFWGALVQQLPVPCHVPVRSYLRDCDDVSSNKKGLSEKWVRDVIPYCASLELVHRKHSSVLMPGSGRGQKLRLEIVSGMLLNVEGHDGFAPQLDPETLAIVQSGKPASLLPTLARRADFAHEIDVLISSEIIRVEREATTILGPPSSSLRDQIVRRAQRWNSQKEPEIKTYEISEELAARLKLQLELDRAEGGPKAPYDELEHLGVVLASRFSVAREFATMQAVVDAMGPTIRPRVSSIWCDSRACAVYAVEIKLGMNRSTLAEQIRASFLRATDGFNGLTVSHGSNTEFFNPEWPEFEQEDLQIEIDETITF